MSFFIKVTGLGAEVRRHVVTKVWSENTLIAMVLLSINVTIINILSEMFVNGIRVHRHIFRKRDIGKYSKETIQYFWKIRFWITVNSKFTNNFTTDSWIICYFLMIMLLFTFRPDCRAPPSCSERGLIGVYPG